MNLRGQTLNIPLYMPRQTTRRVFHGMENFLKVFPRYGKLFAGFSTLWKTFLDFFHSMENFFGFFPQYGKLFSTPWKTAPVLAAVILAGCAKSEPPLTALPAGQDVAATAALSTNRIRIGDPVELVLTVLHREGTAADIPSIARDRDILVRDTGTVQTPLPDGLLRTEQTVRFTSMTITNHVLAEGAAITVSTPEGLHWTTPFPFAALEVVSSLAPGETDPRPAKGGLARWPAPASRRIWIALAILALLAGVFAALRKFLTTPRTILHMPPPVPAHQTALDAIEALRAKGWIEALNIEPFYVELSGIIRRYLEARFGLRAPERTTEEFIRDALTSRKLSDAHQSLVAGFLEQSDLVKFARHAPGQGDMRNALDSADRLVRETMDAAPDPHPLAGWVNEVGTSGGTSSQHPPSSPMAQGHGGRAAPPSSPMAQGHGGRAALPSSPMAQGHGGRAAPPSSPMAQGSGDPGGSR
jgi:hypothetical protein